MIVTVLKLMDTPEDPESRKQVVLNGKSVYDMLPRMKNSKGEELERPQLPTTRKMCIGIEDRLNDTARADVCKGLVTDAILFDYDVDVDGDADTEIEVSEGEDEEASGDDGEGPAAEDESDKSSDVQVKRDSGQALEPKQRQMTQTPRTEPPSPLGRSAKEGQAGTADKEALFGGSGALLHMNKGSPSLGR